jgi:CMP-N-acetylneuraminic acid synthetase
MMDKYIGFIAVKMDSKRVPNKNLQLIDGQTLISRAISTLNKVDKISDIILYCSDESIKEYIEPDLKYTFIKRPKYLDDDKITFKEFLNHFINKEDVIDDTDTIVFLSCTTPFINPETIDDMIKRIGQGFYDTAFTARKIKNYCWFNDNILNYNIDDVPSTQIIKPVLEEVPVYIFPTSFWKTYERRIGIRPYIKIVDSLEGWDIDFPHEMELARFIPLIKRKMK